MLKKIIGFVNLDLTELEFAAPNPWMKRLFRQARITLYVAKRLVNGRHNERAAALTYLSLLAIIPLLAVVFSLFSALGNSEGVRERAQSFLLDYIPDSSEQVAIWLKSFLDNFKAGAIGSTGMIALLVTVIMTLKAVEDALNKTWAVHQPRGWGMRLIIYWSLITVTPLLLGASLALTASTQVQVIQVPGIVKGLVPFLATSTAFFALYFILPSAKVSVRAAWTGGLVAGALFELVKWAYTLYTSKSVSSNALYGSLAAFPVFVIWLNYSWRIVMFGADVVHAIQYSSSDPTEETDPRTNQATREEAAVRIAALIAAAFINREPPPTSRVLTGKLMLPAHLVDVLCRHLLRRGLIREEREGRGFIPASPPEALTMADVIHVMRHEIGVAHWPLRSDSSDLIDDTLSDAEEAATNKMRAITWTKLADDPLGKKGTIHA